MSVLVFWFAFNVGIFDVWCNTKNDAADVAQRREE